MSSGFNEYESEVIIADENDFKLPAILGMPPSARALVIFAHGSGSSRFSPRNQFVARFFQKKHYATLLVDLLNESEEAQREFVFNIPLLAGRLNLVKYWSESQIGFKGVPVAFFGASTGAAAALVAAAQSPEKVFAIVSRGGRPDLTGNFLERVRTPVLFIVGGSDESVLDLTTRAVTKIQAPVEVKVIPDAGHLFEEPGKLEQVAKYAYEWLERQLSEFATKNSLIGDQHEFSASDII